MSLTRRRTVILENNQVRLTLHEQLGSGGAQGNPARTAWPPQALRASCGSKRSKPAAQDSSEPLLDSHNVVWNTQSKNSSESMPVGGGDID